MTTISEIIMQFITSKGLVSLIKTSSGRYELGVQFEHDDFKWVVLHFEGLPEALPEFRKYQRLIEIR